MATVEISVRQFAQDEPFASNAFAHLVGKKLKLRTSLGIVREGMQLNAADVSEDGAYADLILEAPYALMALVTSGLI